MLAFPGMGGRDPGQWAGTQSHDVLCQRAKKTVGAERGFQYWLGDHRVVVSHAAMQAKDGGYPSRMT